jgi:hypothetical protein
LSKIAPFETKIPRLESHGTTSYFSVNAEPFERKKKGCWKCINETNRKDYILKLADNTAEIHSI